MIFARFFRLTATKVCWRLPGEDVLPQALFSVIKRRSIHKILPWLSGRSAAKAVEFCTGA